MSPGVKLKVSTLLPVENVNAITLDNEIAWFKKVLQTRFDQYFEREQKNGESVNDIYAVKPPELEFDQSEYSGIVRQFNMGFDERLVLVLALLPHLQPQALDTLLIHNQNLARGFSEFGGWSGKHHSGFLPTCETAVFILAGNDLSRRIRIMPLFQPDHYLSAQGIIKVTHTSPGEPFLSASLTLSADYLARFTTGQNQKPDFDVSFPAKHITTELTWSDLVLSPDVMDEVENIIAWLQHSTKIMQHWKLGRNIKPGYRTLFYGPPGTGKTLTATIIGTMTDTDVYRIDLSLVVSKYIGETEKNLGNIFDQAVNKNWILFFDEADALFGKRTQTSSAHDRYANQEVSYLLQRIEDYPGVVILATNLKANIDEAFARRFQSSVHFALPDQEQRLRLWRGMFNDERLLSSDVDLSQLAEKYTLSGGAITNAVRYAAIQAIRMQRDVFVQSDLVKGIMRELSKEGRTQ